MADLDMDAIRRTIGDGNLREMRATARTLADEVDAGRARAGLLDRYKLHAVARGDDPPLVAWVCSACPGGHVGIVAFEPEADPPVINQGSLTITDVVVAVLEHHRDEHAGEVASDG